MKFESAPVAFGSMSLEPSSILAGAVLFAVLIAFMMGARKETAMFAVFAGVVGVILTI